MTHGRNSASLKKPLKRISLELRRFANNKPRISMMGTWIRRNRKLWSNACQNMVSFIRRAKFPRPIKVLSRPL